MSEHFSDPRLGRLYAYWRSKQSDGRPPRRRDLDPIEIPDLLPILHLIDVLWDPLRFRHRLVGTDVVRHMARDVTGLMVDESLYGPATDEIFESLRKLATECRPYRRQARLDWHGRQWLAVESVELPLTGDAGEVSMILRGTSFTPMARHGRTHPLARERLRLSPLPM
ncbi:MAG: PAS domain-containing protein [Alphaproteobacteria bacterium]